MQGEIFDLKVKEKRIIRIHVPSDIRFYTT